MSRPAKVDLTGPVAATAGVLFVLAVMFSLAVRTAAVALVWNTLDLHSVFGAGSLSFTQCVAVAVGLGLISGIVRS